MCPRNMSSQLSAVVKLSPAQLTFIKLDVSLLFLLDLFTLLYDLDVNTMVQLSFISFEYLLGDKDLNLLEKMFEVGSLDED